MTTAVVNYLLILSILVFAGRFVADADTQGLLYPRESETREVKKLDGIWQFIKSDINDPDAGIREEWYGRNLGEGRPTVPIAVPASYNDLFQSDEFRDHVGTVWYERNIYVPRSWSVNKLVWLRFGSVHYKASVWVNGKLAMTHEGGHLPFEADVSALIEFGQNNRITVECDNSLTYSSIPHGQINRPEGDNGRLVVQAYSMDFFNYAGIHRSVQLYTTPLIYIEDVYIRTDIEDETIGRVIFEITASGTDQNADVSAIIMLRDKEGTVVGTLTSNDLTGVISIPDAKLWWPYLMNENPGYLYTFEVILQIGSSTIDIYRRKFGIRSISWNNRQILINGMPIYFRGFGRHEDSDFRGKGFDYPLLTKDFSLIKWIGANAYRTSHYPYAEESLEFADEHGIMVIDECAAVNIEHFTDEVLENHKSIMEQLIHRDRSYPSVIMWSIANEPRSTQNEADQYFQQLAEFTHLLDPFRPITGSLYNGVNNDKMAQHLDVISFNRYNAWYSNMGLLDTITNNVVNEAISWFETYNKPVIMSEYGADTYEGLHIMPSFAWSEEFQRDYLAKHFKAFDILRQSDFFIGEFIWVFADFRTNQAYNRVGGNKKGIFTRQRQPKGAAFLVRRRYFNLAQEIDNFVNLPSDLHPYVLTTAAAASNTTFHV